MSGAPEAKRAKIENDDDGNELTHTVWEHYRNYLDSMDADEGEGGDIDELHELIELAKESIDKSSLPVGNIDSLEILCPSWKSRKEMIPVLLSVAYHQLADGAISEYLMMEQQKQATSDGENNQSCTIGPSDIANAMEIAQNLLIESLEWYPYNASTWSMGANFGRMSQSLSISSSRTWYEMAVRASTDIREHALEALNDESIPDEEKEWIELLVLNQVVGVEYEDDEDENDEEEEENDEEDENNPEEDDEQEDTGWYSASSVESTARFMCAMLWSMDGRHDRALDHLKSFGLTHRLHPNVWRTGPPGGQKSSLTAPTKPPLVFQPEGGVIPPSLYDSMLKLFAPNAAYWKESDYSTRGYYSFFHDFEPKNTNKPSNLIEEVIINHLLPRAQQCLDNMTESEKDASNSNESTEICGFEWWAHTRPIQANLGHNLHFDTDESMLDQEGKVTHPVLSSVLYLTGGNDNVSSGATIILDETPDSTTLGQSCYLGIPKDNSFLIFPGNRLHGVLPCPGIQHSKKDSVEKDKSMDIKTLMHDWKNEKKTAVLKEDPPHRLTFMVGFWTRNVPATMKHRSLYGPCGPLPPATEEHTWVSDMMQGYSDETTTRLPVANKIMTATALPQVSPAWEIIEANETEGKNGEDDETGPQLNIPHGIDHRFFVRGAPECFRNSLFEDRETTDQT